MLTNLLSCDLALHILHSGYDQIDIRDPSFRLLVCVLGLSKNLHQKLPSIAERVRYADFLVECAGI